ncbi:hypothetical protein [uncultured Marixanthomonas sp.]|uniref:hypothetical protein n=1 Tax=uncultured Marixanthomonas sp. TaxID=757245 RepID=UPI0030D7F957|tara:strand:- start:242345 stop:243325 length:981 start_codon:yes stop_codon:yes gene_type:complete
MKLMIAMFYNFNEFSSNVNDLSINVFICSASFEDRCFVIPKLIEESDVKESYIFFNENEAKSICVNAEELSNLLEIKSNRVALNSNDAISNYIEIMRVINDITHNYKKPNILIDTTTFTHESLLVLIRLIENKKQLLGNVFLSYVGAKEYSVNDEKDEDKWLSKGVDEIRTIIGFPGFTDPTKKNHLIILFGFEYDRTLRIIDEYEYDSITLGFGDQPIEDNHMKINFERHKRLLSRHPEASEFKFSLTDPSETKNQLLEYIEKEKLSDKNIVIAPMNNKISTVGAGFAAISNQNIQLAYAKASLYNTEGYSSPSDNIYFFKIDFE